MTTYVPAVTYKQAKDDSHTQGDLRGPCNVYANPAIFTDRHVQLSAIWALSRRWPQPLSHSTNGQTTEANILQTLAHLALG